MSLSAVRPGGETPGWLLRFFDWYGAQKRMGDQMNGTGDTRIQELQKRFDGVGWGLLFLLFAALALPNGNVEYASAAAVGGSMLLLNVVRIATDVPVRWFSVILGASMLVGGSAAIFGVKMDVFVLFFALAGLVTIAGAFRKTGEPKAA
jgi:hypothetical protein